MRSIAALVACASLLITVPSCGTSSEGPGTSAGGADASTLRVGLAYDIGGRGDHSWNDFAASGLDDAKKNLGLGKSKEVEGIAGETDQHKEDRLRSLAASGYNPVIALGYAYSAPMKKVARQFPRTRFAVVDDDSVTAPNVTNLMFADEEGAFLVGAAAALKTRTGNVGFVGGVVAPVVKRFEAGYRQGVAYVNPHITVQTRYLTRPPDLTGFNDPAKGKAAADAMYAAGADVVYQGAGGSGAGVFEAAKEHQAWAIGADSDQAVTAAPDVRPYILTSMMKKVNVAVYDYLADTVDGTVRPGPVVYDLALGGVDYATGGGHIKDIQPKLEQLKQEIIHHKVKVVLD
ncbi:BMP family protein [Planotetraspora sp. GP83]|uniref:BMP family lipoprotein n=1 Tax=Planotetraspora sp. GP83 TaxID=3156264 RepID=UPI003514EC31